MAFSKIKSTKTLDPVRFDEWDSFVDLSPQGDVFCYSWWLDVITGSNFKIYIVEEKGEIVAGFPAAYDDQNRINEPPLTRTLGVLYKPQPDLSDHKRSSNERKWLTRLLENIPPEEFLQFCTHHTFTDWLPFRWKGLKQTTRYTYILDYEGQTLTDLSGRLSKGRKESINKAHKYDIKVEEADDFDLVYRFTTHSYERQGLKFKVPFDDLYQLDESIKKYGNRLILRAVDRIGAIHAVLYVTYNHKSAYALLSGSDASLRKYGGHTLVMWEAVKYFIDKVRYFNFGGSDIENIEEHLRGFGGVLTPYFHIYNQRLLSENDSLKFHIVEILYHMKSIAGKITKKSMNFLAGN